MRQTDQGAQSVRVIRSARPKLVARSIKKEETIIMLPSKYIIVIVLIQIYSALFR
jgi:hypothetical protein